MNKIEAVLFDMDGVLLDSEQYICRAGIMMFKEKGLDATPEDFLAFTGMGENRYLGGVAEKHNFPFELEKDKARTYEIYEEIVKGKLEPLAGVIDFIDLCKSRNLKLAVATSADLIKMQINLREIGLAESQFDATVNGLEIKNKKPAPDIFLKAAEKLQVQADRCLVVEDAVSGVEAGKAAGSKVLGLTTTFSAEDLCRADWITHDLSGAGTEVLDW
jgi:HAD superfamily hydrolase (TIGR01509 family)